jgi:hypothetical protein
VDLSGLIILALFWFLVNLLGKGKGQGKQPRQRPRPAPPTSQGQADATQREGSQLEALFRELERRLEQASPERGPRGRPASIALPPAEEVEERESLGVEPEVVSLEEEAKRPARLRVDRDEGAERIEAARVAAAQARSGALTRADHAVFDARVRQQPADATAVRPPTPERLRQAMIWREILGPPVSLRDLDR